MSRHTITHAEEIFIGAPVGFGINQSNRGMSMAVLTRLELIDVEVGDVDGLITAAGSGLAGALGDLVIDGAFADANGVGLITTPRNIELVSTNAGDGSQVVTITGRDTVGNLLVEALTLNGTTVVPGASAFSAVTNINVDVVLAGNLTVGTSVTLANVELGLQGQLVNAYDVLHAFDGAGAAEGGTFTVADQTDPPTAVTGDARGTYNPANLPDASADYILLYVASDLTKEGYGVNFTG